MPEPEPEPEPEAEAVAEPEAETEDDDIGGLSAQELDEMFGDDEPEAFQSIVTPEDDDDDEDLNPDDIPEPDPIPQVFTADDDDTEPQPRRIGRIIAISSAVLLLVILGAGFFLKSQIVSMVPAAAGIYEMIGIGGEKFGAGLQINNVKSDYETEQGLEILVVRGSVANISDVERTVPVIQVDLYDADGHSIQKAEAVPVRNKLDAGQDVRFKARLVEPSPLARSIEVTFKNPEDAEAEAQ